MRQLLSFFTATLFISSMAYAQGKGGGSGVYFDTTFIPKIVNKNDTESFTESPGAATETGSGVDSKTTLGVVMGGWFVGATYNYYSLSTKRSNRVGGDAGLKESTTNTQLGATVGWIGASWRFLGTAILSGEKVVDSKNIDNTGVVGSKKITNKEASGFQALVGYSYPVTNNFSIGPTLAYRSLVFAKQSKVNRITPSENYSNSSLYSDSIETNLDILLTLALRF